MALIKYPDGRVVETTSEPKSKRNLKKSRLGTDFEQAINESNEYYLNLNLASIYKKPTPIQVVKVDYPSRNKARISEAYYKTPSTTDYNGIYKGKHIDFEAKSCHQMNFPFEKIYPHQIRHLEKIKALGGIAFLIIEFSLVNEVYILDASFLVQKYEESLNNGRKSIPYDYFKEHGASVKIGFKPRLDYLKAVDLLYFKDENPVD